MSYNSKYSGQQVEALLDQVANGNTGGSGGSGGITTELDPIFSASAAAKITDDNITSWNNKVDKVDGKQLSTEDFTTLLKQKLDGLSNYDDTEIQEAVSKLRTDLDTLVSGDTTTAIKTFNEVIAFLDGLEDTEDLSGIIASIDQQIAAKQEKLVSGTNIKTINGTSILGSGDIEIQTEANVKAVDTAESVDEPNIKYLTTAEQSLSDEEKQLVKDNLGIEKTDIDLSEYAKTTDVPTALSDLDNDTGFITVDTTVNKAKVANYLHSTTYKLGGKSVPIYLSNGAVSSCNSYAGGTAVTLNGSSKAASTASFYAPTSYGTSGYLLKANGRGSAPTWISDTSIKSSTSAVKDVQLVTSLPSSPVSTTLYLIAE